MPASGLTPRAHRHQGWLNQLAGKSSHLVPLQHLLWEETQHHWEVWRLKKATVSPPASSSFSPAPNPRATASKASTLVTSCSLTIRTLPPPPPQDPHHHQSPAELMNQATQKLQALGRGREKCQRSNAPGRSSNATSILRLASSATQTAWPAMITTTKFALKWLVIQLSTWCLTQRTAQSSTLVKNLAGEVGKPT